MADDKVWSNAEVGKLFVSIRDTTRKQVAEEIAEHIEENDRTYAWPEDYEEGRKDAAIIAREHAQRCICLDMLPAGEQVRACPIHPYEAGISGAPLWVLGWKARIVPDQEEPTDD